MKTNPITRIAITRTIHGTDYRVTAWLDDACEWQITCATRDALAWKQLRHLSSTVEDIGDVREAINITFNMAELSSALTGVLK